MVQEFSVVLLRGVENKGSGACICICMYQRILTAIGFEISRLRCRRIKMGVEHPTTFSWVMSSLHKEVLPSCASFARELKVKRLNFMVLRGIYYRQYYPAQGLNPPKDLAQPCITPGSNPNKILNPSCTLPIYLIYFVHQNPTLTTEALI